MLPRHCVYAILPVLLTIALPLAGQEFDPLKQATGWASFDRDGSCAFQDGKNKKLVIWSRGTGITSAIDLTRLTRTAEKWVIDPAGNAWVVSGNQLQQVDRKGKLGDRFNLPGPVADVAWDARTFVLSYRSPEPYLEKRDLISGKVLWTLGKSAEDQPASPAALHRIVIRDTGEILLSSGVSLNLRVLEPGKGQAVASFDFTASGAPTLALGSQDRGPMAWWLDHDAVVAAYGGSQAPASGMQGLFLVKLDLVARTATPIPTGLSEDHALVGMVDNAAVLRSPGGGLVYFPMP